MRFCYKPTLGPLLKAKRKHLGLPQRKVAKILGVHTMFVSNFETGKAALPYKHLKNVIDIYQIPQQIIIEALLKDEKEKIERFIA